MADAAVIGRLVLGCFGAGMLIGSIAAGSGWILSYSKQLLNNLGRG